MSNLQRNCLRKQSLPSFGSLWGDPGDHGGCLVENLCLRFCVSACQAPHESWMDVFALPALEAPRKWRGLSSGDSVLRTLHPGEESSGHRGSQHGPQVPGETAGTDISWHFMCWTDFCPSFSLKLDCLYFFQSVLSLINHVGPVRRLFDHGDLLGY